MPHDRILDLSKELIQIPCMLKSTLTSKNQTTIPKAVVEALNLRPSDQLVYEIEEDGRIILSAKTSTFASVAASLPRKASKGPARSVEQMKFSVRAMAGKRMSRTKS
jgi:AbrB family looped-hinge helix DNA binding protein